MRLPLLSFALAAVAAGATPLRAEDPVAQPTVSDGLVTYDTWNVAYCEFLLVKGSLLKLEAEVYNTLGLDACDPDAFDAVDAGAVAKAFGAREAFKNGPRNWVVSELSSHQQAAPADVEDFGGIKVRKVAVVQLTRKMRQGSSPYEPTTVERDTRYSYASGRPVFILDDPDGTPWVMQAYARIVDPDLGLDDLAGLGARLKLPAGWSYRTETLTSELVVHPVDGVARILQDDLENTYDACFETACEPNAP